MLIKTEKLCLLSPFNRLFSKLFKSFDRSVVQQCHMSSLPLDYLIDLRCCKFFFKLQRLYNYLIIILMQITWRAGNILFGVDLLMWLKVICNYNVYSVHLLHIYWIHIIDSGYVFVYRLNRVDCIMFRLFLFLSFVYLLSAFGAKLKLNIIPWLQYAYLLCSLWFYNSLVACSMLV